MPISLAPRADQLDQLVGALGVGEAHGDARVGDPERADQRGDGVDGEGGEGDEVEVAGDHPDHGGHVGPHGVDRPQRLARRAARTPRPAAVSATRRPMRGNSSTPSSRSRVAHGVGERRLGDEARLRGGR